MNSWADVLLLGIMTVVAIAVVAGVAAWASRALVGWPS